MEIPFRLIMDKVDFVTWKTDYLLYSKTFLLFCQSEFIKKECQF